MHTNYVYKKLANVRFAKPTNPPYAPADILKAYNIPPNLGSGAIAIIGAFNLPSALGDFNTFSAMYGLPTETSANVLASTNAHFQVIYASGTKPNDDAGWGGEASLDIEWSHSMAPNAKIYLIEADTNAFSDFDTALAIANSLPNVHEVSMSYGTSGEFSGETSLEGPYSQPGIVYFASSGDIGGVRGFPAISPNVVGVGGTHLVTDANGAVTSETAWDGAGGGPSLYYGVPVFQQYVTGTVGAARGCPDISAVADPNTGVWVYSSFASGGWVQVGGTSLSSPLVAGIANARGHFSNSSPDENFRNYAKMGSSNFRDVTSGTAGSFTATPGWDFITGVGVPIGLYTSPITLPPTSGSLTTGTTSSTLSDLLTVDSKYFRMNGVVSGPNYFSQLYAIESLSGFTPSKLSDLTLTIDASISDRRGTMAVKAYDFTAATYVLIKNFDMTRVSKSAQFVAKFPAGDFVSGGQIVLQVNNSIPTSLGTGGLTLSVNRIKVDADLFP